MKALFTTFISIMLVSLTAPTQTIHPLQNTPGDSLRSTTGVSMRRQTPVVERSESPGVVKPLGYIFRKG